MEEAGVLRSPRAHEPRQADRLSDTRPNCARACTSRCCGSNAATPRARSRRCAGVDGVLEASLFGRVLRVVVAEAMPARATVRRASTEAGIVCRAVDEIEPVTRGRVRPARAAWRGGDDRMTRHTLDARRARFRLSRLLAMARKECLQLRRDRRSLALAFLLPLVMLVLFGYAITTEVRGHPDGGGRPRRTPESRALIDAFERSGYFTLVDDTGE